MTADVTTCADCIYWSDKPVAGTDGTSWARCRKYGWLQSCNFYCKSGRKEETADESET